MRILKYTTEIFSMALYSPTIRGCALLVTGGLNGDCTVWELDTFTKVRVLEGIHNKRIRGVSIYDPQSINTAHAARKKGNPRLTQRVLVVTCSDDKTAAIWDLFDGTIIRHLSGGHRWSIVSATIIMPTSGSTPYVVTSGWDKFSIIWNIETGEQIIKLESDNSSALTAIQSFVSPQLHKEFGNNLLETAEIPFLLTVGFNKIITLWDGETGNVLRHHIEKHTDIISCISVFVPPPSEKGLYAITGSYDCTAIIWDLLTGNPIRILEGHNDWIRSIAIFRISTGKPFFIMALTGSQDGTAILWDILQGIPIRKFEKMFTSPVCSVAFLPRLPTQGTSSTSAYDPNLRNCEAYYIDTTTIDTTICTDTTTSTNTASSNTTLDQPNPLQESNKNNNPTVVHTAEHSQEHSPEDSSFPILITGSEEGKVIVWDLESIQSQRINYSDNDAEKEESVVNTNYNNNYHTSTSSSDNSHNSNTILYKHHQQQQQQQQQDSIKNKNSTKDFIISMNIFLPKDRRRPILLTGTSSGNIIIYDVLLNTKIKEIIHLHNGDITGLDCYDSLNEKFLLLNWKNKIKYTNKNKEFDLYQEELRDCSSNEGSVLIIVSTGVDGNLIQCDYDSGSVIQTLENGHTDGISHLTVTSYTTSSASTIAATTTTAAASSSSHSALSYTIAVTCSFDMTAVVWNLNTGSIMHRLTGAHSDGVTQSCVYIPALQRIHPEGVAVSPSSHTHPEGMTTSQQSSSDPEGMAASPLVITAGIDAQAVVWNLKTGTIIRILKCGHKERIKSICCFQPVGGKPVVITAGYDRIAVIWDIYTGTIVRTLSGEHKNWITTVRVAQPIDNGNPFIVTAGFDCIIILWDYYTGEVLARLEGGHHAAIRCLAIYSGIPEDHGRISPIIYSGGHDSTVIRWDSQYPFLQMPTKSIINKLFQLDLFDKKQNWVRISRLSVQFGQALWMENSNLFIQAVILKRCDFLIKFKNMLKLIINRLNKINNKSILIYTIDNRDIQSIKIILKCWLELLNTTICNITLIKLHSTFLLPINEIIYLGYVYPAECMNFILSLKLIKIENISLNGILKSEDCTIIGSSISSVHDINSILSIDSSCSNITCSSSSGSSSSGRNNSTTAINNNNNNSSSNNSNNKYHNSNNNNATTTTNNNNSNNNTTTIGKNITLLFIPLQNTCHIKLLVLYLYISVQLNTIDIFNNEIVIYSLRYIWEKYSYYIHIKGIFYFCLFLLFYTINILLFEELINNNHINNINYNILAWFIQTITFILICIRLYKLYLKLLFIKNNKNSTIFTFFMDFWNILNLFSLLFGIMGMIVRYIMMKETLVSKGLLAIATILIWLYGLYFIRPFRVSGPLGEYVLYNILYLLLLL